LHIIFFLKGRQIIWSSRCSRQQINNFRKRSTKNSYIRKYSWCSWT